MRSCVPVSTLRMHTDMFRFLTAVHHQIDVLIREALAFIEVSTAIIVIGVGLAIIGVSGTAVVVTLLARDQLASAALELIKLIKLIKDALIHGASSARSP